MIQAITDHQPSEKGTAVFTIAPVDEDGNALTFGQLKNPAVQLMKSSDGSAIPGCAFADKPLSSLSFVLSGNDLAVFGVNDSGLRLLSFQAAYDSTAGTDLPLNDECKFQIKKLAGQVDES